MVDKEIDRIPKNQETDIIIRIDEYNGTTGLTIREFVKSERYTGFTKAGTRIPADKFKAFKAAINSIDEKDLEGPASSTQKTQTPDAPAKQPSETKKPAQKKSDVKELEF